jgi:hypothetical protein
MIAALSRLAFERCVYYRNLLRTFRTEWNSPIQIKAEYPVTQLVVETSDFAAKNGRL